MALRPLLFQASWAGNLSSLRRRLGHPEESPGKPISWERWHVDDHTFTDWRNPCVLGAGAKEEE